MKKEPWYKEGLHFSCHQCGVCCTGDPGYIWVNEDEIEELARALKMDVPSFGRKYLRKINNRYYSLLENGQGDCVLWNKDKGCTAYAARPQQCRTYPFWPEVVKTRKTWEEEARLCRGIAEGLRGRGKKHDVDFISKEIK
ncbi:MAG: YkgJ family cysteine cluster protein [Planctomycetota bacterium]